MHLSDRKIKKALTPYLLILPAVLLLAVFLLGALNGVLQGFGIMPFLGMTEFTLEYYRAALSRPDLFSSIQYSFYLATASSLIAVGGGVGLSLALTKARTSRLQRLINLQIPLMTMHSIVALAVLFLFTSSGLFARGLAVFGLVADANSFESVLGASNGWGILLTYAWKEIPFVAFCTVTIMAHISDTLGEAAATLGANATRTFFDITLPLCAGAIIKAFLIVFAFAFGSYEVPFLLGPSSPQAIPILAYQEFQNPDIAMRSYAMALNGITTGITSVLALLYFMILKREERG